VIARWLIGLIVCAAFAAGAYYFYYAWTDFRYQKAEVAYLESEMRNYDRLERMYQEQEQKLEALKVLWSEIEQVGLAPEDWRVYSLSVTRNLDWQELERLMSLASNDIRGEGQYWFKPGSLRVTRVVEEGAGNDSGEEGVTIKAEQDGRETEVKMFYQTNMNGSFLIPKDRQ
jgi:hypothetical protein